VIKKLSIEEGQPLRVAYIQKPLQMLRTTASFNKVFEDEIASNRCVGIPCTIDYRKKSPGSYALLGGVDVERIIAGELWRIVIYTAAKDAIPEYRGTKGLIAIPAGYWDDLIIIIDRYLDKEGLRGPSSLYSTPDSGQIPNEYRKHMGPELALGYR